MPQLLENAFMASAAELKNKKNLQNIFCQCHNRLSCSIILSNIRIVKSYIQAVKDHSGRKDVYQSSVHINTEFK